MNFDINRMKRSDQVIAVCGALLFISLFLPFFGADGGHLSGHRSGFLAWAGLWLGFLAGGLGFFATLGIPWPTQLPVTKTIATLGISALSTLLLVLKFLVGYKISAYVISVHLSRSFGLYFALIAVIVQVVFAGLAFKESGESLPTKADFQGLTGGGGSAPGYPPAQGYTPPPAPGYAPPPPPAGGFAAPPSFGTPSPSFGTPPPPSFGTPPAPAEPPASWQQPPAE